MKNNLFEMLLVLLWMFIIHLCLFYNLWKRWHYKTYKTTTTYETTNYMKELSKDLEVLKKRVLTWLIFEGVASDASVTVVRRTPFKGQRVQAGVGDEQVWRSTRHCRKHT